jgi:pentatricopeptide repeat protein
LSSFSADQYCFNGVINAHVKSGDKNAVMHAESTFRRMQECDVKPNNVSFSLMIHAYTKSGKQGSWKRAEALLEEMHTCYDVAPDVVTFNTVLWAIAKSGEADAAERAERMLIQMIQRKLSNKTSVTPDTVSFASVINAWTYTNRYNFGIAEGAWRVLQQQLELVDSGISDSLKPTIHHCAYDTASSLKCL